MFYNKVMEKIKTVFFDVDGVLSAPNYFDKDLGKCTIGFSDKVWLEFLEENKEDSYKDCKVPTYIISFINDLITKGITLYVLSSVENELEAKAKTKFLNHNFKDIFKRYRYVRTDDQKIEFIKDFCRDYDMNLDECMLVDDTYMLLLKAHCEGIKAVHIANILADLV